MNEHQEFEASWWGDCANTYGEETKQLTYAHRMGLQVVPAEGHWPVYDMAGRSVLDIGGGPASMLLKCRDLGPAMVLDPCPYPDWVSRRYSSHDIMDLRATAESQGGRILPPLRAPGDTRPNSPFWDEVWIYNVLQHVEDPEKVIQLAVASANSIRIFEWLNTPPTLGHPHTLYANQLVSWITGLPPGSRELSPGRWGWAWAGDKQALIAPDGHVAGHIETMHENGCDGLAFYGVF